MPEYRKLRFEKKDFIPYGGFKSFKRRNGSAAEDFENPKYIGFMAYHAVCYGGIAAAVILAVSYASR